MTPEALVWLKKHRLFECPDCEPKDFNYNLLQSTYYCSMCDKVWKYRYVNPASPRSRATRFWWYEGDTVRKRVKNNESRKARTQTT